ncbi:TetR family transcriptional regulator C-terminal domain-containing protein [Myceligenerans pegani]|uniref:TetR family transcriptional regulator C-terminal domain-containing protein n=1 Tax=Myceligenerans pegani TaxID=2776917 RepID=UPI001CF0B3CE|nr:TetR/AcrR family transcriptional regulator [Myceligenerans sp. TRM 65318]
MARPDAATGKCAGETGGAPATGAAEAGHTAAAGVTAREGAAVTRADVAAGRTAAVGATVGGGAAVTRADAPAGSTADLRRVRGDRTRRAVLDQAVQDASVHGLGALSLGGLAASAPVNKSAIAGLFGSKEGLQLAVVARAREVYTEAVIVPARGAERGLARVWELVRRWIDYSRRRVFRGGCFFRTVEIEFDMRPGPVRDAVAEAQADWEGYLAHQVEIAVDAGDLSAGTDPRQVAFEVNALLSAANDRSLLTGDESSYTYAATAVRTLLTAHGADPAMLR